MPSRAGSPRYHARMHAHSAQRAERLNDKMTSNRDRLRTECVCSARPWPRSGERGDLSACARTTKKCNGLCAPRTTLYKRTSNLTEHTSTQTCTSHSGGHASPRAPHGSPPKPSGRAELKDRVEHLSRLCRAHHRQDALRLGLRRVLLDVRLDRRDVASLDAAHFLARLTAKKSAVSGIPCEGNGRAWLARTK